MAHDIGILVFPDVQQLDLAGPYDVFASSPGTRVHLVWKDLEPLRSSTGLWLKPSVTFADCPPLEVICVPGGGGVNALLQDGETLEFIRRQAESARFTTSVCTGSLVLGAAGLLRGRRAASHWNARDFLVHFGATPVGERVVSDGNIITAGGVTSGIDFGLTVLAALAGEAEAQTVQLCLEYAPSPPYRSGTPDEAPPEVLEAARRRLQPSRDERARMFADKP